MLFYAMDLTATFVFALSGAVQGVKSRLDLFGVLVAYAAAVAGGIARDLMIGAVPPGAIADWRYLAAAGAAGLVGFFASDAIGKLRTPVLLLFDAAGLCLFLRLMSIYHGWRLPMARAGQFPDETKK